MARRLRLLVKRIPVNMMKEASRNMPPTTYFSLVTHDFLAPNEAPFDHFLLVEALIPAPLPLLRALKMELSVQYDESRELQLSA